MSFQQPRLPANATKQPTICVLCSHNCGVRVDVENNRIVNVEADPSNPITRGYSCNKAYSIAHYVNHAQRVEHPLKRQPDGSFARISWDRAIREIAGKLRAIRDAYSGNAIALLGVGGQANHMDAPYALAFMRSLGSRWWFNALAQEKTQHPLVDGWLFGAPSSVFFHADAEHSQCVLMIGTNPILSNRGSRATDLIKELASDADRALIVVDPRLTETAKRADRHLQVRPGSDVYLLLGMAQHIVHNNLHDAGFAARYIDGLDQLRAALSAIDTADMARRCDIEHDQLIAVAETYAKAASASIFVDLGLEQSRFSTLTAYLMRVLAALTGNIGNKGGNIFQGTFAPDLPALDKEPFKAPISGIEGIAMFSPFGMFSPNLFPEEALADRHDRIRAAIVEGANPAVQYADSPRYREAFAALDLLVVIDPAFTETAQHADYVLPTPTGYEKWEYATFPKGYPEIYAQIRPPVVQGPPEALPEGEIYYRLAREVGVIEKASGVLRMLGKRTAKVSMVPAYFTAAMAAAAVKNRDPNALLARVLFWTYETVGPRLPSPTLAFLWLTCVGYAYRNRAEIQRAHPDINARSAWSLGTWLFAKLLDNPQGFVVGALDPATNLTQNLKHESGRIALHQPAMLAEVGRALADDNTLDPAFPLILNAGLRTHWNANTIQRDPAWRKGKGPHCMVLAHPDDAASAGVEAGKSVRVETATGAVSLPLVTHAGVKPGHIHIPNGFGLSYPDPKTGELSMTGAGLNELTSAADRDPFTGCPHHKFVRCRIVPA